MVSREVAQASHAAYQSANEAAKSKQDATIAASKQSRSDNRGYDYESRDQEGNIEGAKKGIAYSYDSKTGASSGPLPPNVPRNRSQQQGQLNFDEQSQESYIQKKNRTIIIKAS